MPYPLASSVLAALTLLAPSALAAQRPYAQDGVAARAGTAVAADSAEAAAALRAIFTAAEHSDLAALDTLYAGESLTVIEGAGIDRTWVAYRDHHLGPELKEMQGLEYRPTDIEVYPAGDVAWAIFRYTLKATVDGRAADVVGRGTAILERRGSRWVVRHTHTSGRARRASDPPAE